MKDSDLTLRSERSILQPCGRPYTFHGSANRLLLVLPGNTYPDSCRHKGGADLPQRHSPKGANPGRVDVHGKTVLCVHHGRQAKRYAVRRCNIESGATGRAIPGGAIFMARSALGLDSRLHGNDVVVHAGMTLLIPNDVEMPSILCVKNTGCVRSAGGCSFAGRTLLLRCPVSLRNRVQVE